MVTELSQGSGRGDGEARAGSRAGSEMTLGDQLGEGRLRIPGFAA